MTFRQMRLLFAGLARNDVPVGLWTVVLRDHVRHSWLGIRRIEQLAPDELGSGPLVPWKRPLTEFEALAQPEYAAMTWLEVLWALGVFKHSDRGWSLVAIEASWPARAEPRYRLVLQRAGIRIRSGQLRGLRADRRGRIGRRESAGAHMNRRCVTKAARRVACKPFCLTSALARL